MFNCKAPFYCMKIFIKQKGKQGMLAFCFVMLKRNPELGRFYLRDISSLQPGRE